MGSCNRRLFSLLSTHAHTDVTCKYCFHMYHLNNKEIKSGDQLIYIYIVDHIQIHACNAYGGWSISPRENQVVDLEVKIAFIYLFSSLGLFPTPPMQVCDSSLPAESSVYLTIGELSVYLTTELVSNGSVACNRRDASNEVLSSSSASLSKTCGIIFNTNHH